MRGTNLGGLDARCVAFGHLVLAWHVGGSRSDFGKLVKEFVAWGVFLFFWEGGG